MGASDSSGMDMCSVFFISLRRGCDLVLSHAQPSVGVVVYFLSSLVVANLYFSPD